MSLANDYRPQKFSDVVGQKNIIQMLSNAMELGRVGHAYAFFGGAGTGKTSFARIWAKELNCTGKHKPCGECYNCKTISEGKNIDVIEMNTADKRGIDDIREVLAKLKFKPSSRYKILILDEVHMGTEQFFNALLKDLEEPPEYVIFILCTTNPEKIPDTILSRCQIFNFQQISTNDIADRLAYICDNEGFEYEKEALTLIAEYAKGGMRNSISTLEQIACYSNEAITKDVVMKMLGMVNENEFVDIILDLSNSKLDEAIARLNTLVSAGKKIEYIYEELQRQFCTLIKESYSHTSDVNINKKVLLSMSKIIIDYESKIKYCSDKYFAVLSMFNEIADNGSMDINKRIEKLEEAIASGSFKKSAIDMDRISRIQKALKMDSNDRKKLIEKRQEKPKVDDLTNEFLSFTKGEIDYGTN